MTFGVHSEVGKLRKVMVHRPGLEHTRLTPSNAAELLFDDVIWVKRAKEEHDAFAEAMRERGVEVFYAEELFAEALKEPAAREWVCDHVLNERMVGTSLARRAREFVTSEDPVRVADLLIGGITAPTCPKPKVCSGSRPTPPRCCSRRCRTSCSNGTRPAGSSAG